MVFFDLITKGFNKVIAPKFLRLSLRVHKSIPVNAVSLLPLSQRLVSIEVQDEYRQLGKPPLVGLFSNASKTFDEFVDRTWNVLGLEQMVDRTSEMNNSGRKERDDKPTSTAQNNEMVQRSNERVQLLAKYILPAVTSKTIDPPQAFVKWIRGEYLIAKYGLQVQEAIRKHPELRDDAAGLSAFDVQTIDGRDAEFPLDTILPTVKTVRRAFDMDDWARSKVPVSSLDEDMDVDQMTIEQIIHYRLQGQVAYSGPLNAYFEMRRREDSYELWTKDYIFGLANYLLQRIEEMNKQSARDEETAVLDVGAGDGRLVYFLRRAMSEIESSKNRARMGRKDPKLKAVMPALIATDDGSWRAPIYKTSHIQVEQLSVDKAIEKYAPSAKDDNKRLIVLCSWMPPGEDWTRLFRQPVNQELTQVDDVGESNQHDLQQRVTPVEEYILIGESDDGTCGHNWYTWGNFAFHPTNDNDMKEVELAPYEADGYTRVELEDLSALQFSRFDCKRSSESRTVSFRLSCNM